jgi:catechol 2,3-dioxygenase
MLPGATRLGPAELVVTDLARSVRFYRDVIGLEADERGPQAAALTSGGADVLLLAEEPAARRAGRHAGLYHVALLQPTRLELARVAARLAATRTPIQGASDHGTHEAIYLADPDGNGLELAADRPRAEWPDVRDVATYGGGPAPLDQASLFALVEGAPVEPRAGAGMTVGHVHLHVGDLRAAVGFYRDVLGLELQVELPSAAFLAAGGYHHHVAVNTWRGEGVPPVPADAVGLRRFHVLVPHAGALDDLERRLAAAGVVAERGPGDAVLVHDPAGNALAVAVG